MKICDICGHLPSTTITSTWNFGARFAVQTRKKKMRMLRRARWAMAATMPTWRRQKAPPRSSAAQPLGCRLREREKRKKPSVMTCSAHNCTDPDQHTHTRRAYKFCVFGCVVLRVSLLSLFWHLLWHLGQPIIKSIGWGAPHMPILAGHIVWGSALPLHRKCPARRRHLFSLVRCALVGTSHRPHQGFFRKCLLLFSLLRNQGMYLQKNSDQRQCFWRLFKQKKNSEIVCFHNFFFLPLSMWTLILAGGALSGTHL